MTRSLRPSALFALTLVGVFAPASARADSPRDAAADVLSDERYQQKHPEAGDRSGVLDIFGDGASGGGEGGPLMPSGGGGGKKPAPGGTGRPMEGNGQPGTEANGAAGTAEPGDGRPPPDAKNPQNGGENGGLDGSSSPVPAGSGAPSAKRSDDGDEPTGGGRARAPSDDGAPTGEPDERGAPTVATTDKPYPPPPLTAEERERARRERMRQEREKGLRVPVRVQGKGQVEMAPPEPPSAVGQLLSTLLAGLLIAFVVFFLAWGVLAYLRSRRPEDEEAILPKNEGETESSGPVVAPSDIERFAAEGRFTEAVHAMFLVTVRHLAARQLLTLGPDTTARETLRTVRADGVALGELGVLVEAVEISLFGGEELDRATFERCFASYQHLVRSAPEGALPRAA